VSVCNGGCTSVRTLHVPHACACPSHNASSHRRVCPA
jgi:hypothetical protein